MLWKFAKSELAKYRLVPLWFSWYWSMNISGKLCSYHCCWCSGSLRRNVISSYHYNDVIMSAIASQITSLTIVYSTVYSDADQRKHQSSASLAFVRGIHRWPVNSPHKWPVTRQNVSIWWRHHGYCLCKINGSLSSARQDFNNLRHGSSKK